MAEISIGVGELRGMRGGGWDIIIDGALGGWVSPLCTGRTSGWGSFMAGLAGERGSLTARLKAGRLQESLQSVGSNDPRGVGFDVFNKVKYAFAYAFLC